MDMHSVNTIKNNIKTSLTRCELNVTSEIVNFGMSISIDGNSCDNYNEKFTLWVRLYECNNGIYIVDISKIQLPYSKRRKGIFEFMFKRLAKCKYVAEIRITSVCTVEMKSWCLKHKLNEVSKYNYVYKR